MNDQQQTALAEELVQVAEQEQECPVCLAKTIASETLPYLADMMRSAASMARGELEAGNEVDSNVLLTAITNIRAAVGEVKQTIEILKQCDCGDDEEHEEHDVPAPRSSDYGERFYDV